MEVKIDGKLGSGQLILRQRFKDDTMELTLCRSDRDNEMVFYVGAAEFARAVRFLVEVNRVDDC